MMLVVPFPVCPLLLGLLLAKSEAAVVVWEALTVSMLLNPASTSRVRLIWFHWDERHLLGQNTNVVEADLCRTSPHSRERQEFTTTVSSFQQHQ